MDSARKYKVHGVVWIKIWIGIGIAVLVFLIFYLLTLGVLFNSERIRFEECRDGVRQDCEPSQLWEQKGYSISKTVPPQDQADLKQEAESKLALQYEHGVRYYQTGEAAPKISGVEMRGTDYENNWYSSASGTEIEILVRPEGDYERVALYVHPKDSLTPGIGVYQGEFKQQAEGVYLVVYRMPGELEADLEARAVGKGEELGAAFIQLKTK